MGTEKQKVRAGVYLVLERAKKILLVRHAHTGYRDGEFGLPGGHIEAGEPASAAALREARDLLGLKVSMPELSLAHVMHRSEASGTPDDNIDFYFLVQNFPGEAVDKVPEKYDALQWAAWTELPDKTIPEVRYALQCIQQDKVYSEFDFTKS